ncbi:MAG TPA: divalent metal cation transporter [Frateuria sp.]|uniref:NRAMP family divalent metal transporter n=1 Tax=Frateuria sp. TaxID=2211372 RepID=UPI002D8011AD|nr:divalent metal cation transporter [Frateuria sp.]HET6804207.1 divalent metal cation transporter [Frateuria sp.]
MTADADVKVEAASQLLASQSILKVLGPGLITGAADDDPSGIATYSQVGAQFGYGLAWVMLFSYPLMAVTQAISGRIGCVTGRGIAQNLRRHYPRWLLQGVVLLLLIANVVNLGADLGAMGAALQLIIGGSEIPYIVGFAVLCVLLEAFLSYRQYATVLKWLTLSLFAYVAVLFAVAVPWREALTRTFLPTIVLDAPHATALVALLGTTISPYLFFWQASQEVEEQLRRTVKPLYVTPSQSGSELARMTTDTWVGMGYSNLISLFIIIATAATLHASGITDIQSSSQAAEALRPIAGVFTFAVFACGVIGTGLLAVPVLAGSAAYAVCECFDWIEGLDHKLKDARAFYTIITLATLIGLSLNFIGIDPIKALYWSAVLNGVLAAPLMATMLLIATNPRIMGTLILGPAMQIVGWLATAVMLLATIGLLVL